MRWFDRPRHFLYLNGYDVPAIQDLYILFPTVVKSEINLVCLPGVLRSNGFMRPTEHTRKTLTLVICTMKYGLTSTSIQDQYNLGTFQIKTNTVGINGWLQIQFEGVGRRALRVFMVLYNLLFNFNTEIRRKHKIAEFLTASIYFLASYKDFILFLVFSRAFLVISMFIYEQI